MGKQGLSSLEVYKKITLNTSKSLFNKLLSELIGDFLKLWTAESLPTVFTVK